MSKKIYVVYGTEVYKTQERAYLFCKVFTSEKKADRYYDKKRTRLGERYQDKTIDMYTIAYKEKKIK